ncbi:MAG TPA: phosphatidylglycerol lysyltransferase domain-containing protein [Armatimonadota bacterium]|jgi:phosphatidylglycerol lysyltransferase
MDTAIFASQMPLKRRLEVRLIAVLVALMGFVNVASVIAAHTAERSRIVHAIFGMEVVHGSRILTVVAGFYLIMLARGLWRHKRVAWTLSFATLGVSFGLHLIKGLDYEESLVILSLMLGLVLLRPFFHAESDPPSVWYGVATVIAAVLFTAVYGTYGFWFFRTRFVGIHTPVQALQATLALFFQYGDVKVHPIHAMYSRHLTWQMIRAWWFINSIYAVSVGSLSYGLMMLLRPLLVRGKPSVADREVVRGLLIRHGRTTIAHFALLPDKAYCFNADRSGVIAYKVVAGVALALGDPIAPPEAVPALVLQFCNLCARNDWLPAFYQVVPDYLPAYHAADLRTLKIGEDAVVRLDSFSLEGSRMKKVRNAVAAIERRGVRAVRYDLARDPLNLLPHIQEVSDLWLGEQKGSEKTFSLGYWDPSVAAQQPMMVALDDQNRVLAFETLVPMYRADGWATDLMRRRPDAPNGVMEYLFAREALALKEEGWKAYGLGLSPLSTGLQVPDSECPENETEGLAPKPESRAPLDAAINVLYHHFNHFYRFTGLHAFKEKFGPEWEPRYLAYPGGQHLPRVVLAIVRANSSQSLFQFLWKKRATRPDAPRIPEGPETHQ